MLELYYGKENIPKGLTVIDPATHFAHLSSSEYEFYNEDTIAVYIRGQLKGSEIPNWRWAIRDVTSMSQSMKAALMAYYYREHEYILVDLTECSEGALEVLGEIGETVRIGGYINAPIPIPVTRDKVRFNGKKSTMEKVARKISGRRYYRASAKAPFATEPFTPYTIHIESDPYETNEGKGQFSFDMAVKKQVAFVENTNLDTVTWLEMLRSFCNFGRYGELSLESSHALDRVTICGSEKLSQRSTGEPRAEPWDAPNKEVWFIGNVDTRKKSEAKVINGLIQRGHTVILFCRAGQYIKAPEGIERAILKTERTADGASANRIISRP